MKPIKQSQTSTGTVPYPPSYIDKFIQFIQRLPIPYWLVFLLLFLIQSLIIVTLAWVDGSISQMTAWRILFLFPVWQWIPLLIITFLNKTARSTLDTFSRLLGGDGDALDQLKYEFTTMPARGVILSGVIWSALYVIMTYSFSYLYLEFGFRTITRIAVTVEGLFSFAIGGVIYYHSLRQLWLVNRTVKTVKRYNLFDLDPVYSFSRLTAWTGISWVLMLILNLWLFPFGAALELVLSITVIQVALALAAFILPLRFVNSHLVFEKRSLLAKNQQRIEATLTRLHQQIDQNRLTEIELLNYALSGLRVERDILEKIPTLPWRTQTLTGFLSAAILPIILLIIQIIIERWLSG